MRDCIAADAVLAHRERLAQQELYARFMVAALVPPFLERALAVALQQILNGIGRLRQRRRAHRSYPSETKWRTCKATPTALSEPPDI